MSEEYSPAVKLLSLQMSERLNIRNLWKIDAGDLIDAHHFSLSALSAMIQRFSGKPFKEQPQNVEGIMSLVAQFIQGIDICEISISEGLYSQAAALLKQELETIAAIDEYNNNTRKDGKTPQIGKGITTGFGPIYGDLNNISHVSRHNILIQLVTVEKGEFCAPSLVPKYNIELARSLYGNHIWFIVEIGRQLESIFKDIFGEGFSEEEAKWLFIAINILIKGKVIEIPEDAKERFTDINFK